LRIITRLEGTSPLLMHNSRLANPDDEFTKAIAAITGKRKKTEEDRVEIGRLEFAGGLHIDGIGPYVPSASARRCFVEAAKVRRLGKHVERGLIPAALNAHLEYKGPTGVNELWADDTFRNVSVVRIGTSRCMRVRPQFLQWAVSFEWELVPSIIDYPQLAEIVESAGIIEGLGDNRRNGFGRFRSEVQRMP
jgi:hypothetical protein